jgi:hypothetical protein
MWENVVIMKKKMGTKSLQNETRAVQRENNIQHSKSKNRPNYEKRWNMEPNDMKKAK